MKQKWSGKRACRIDEEIFMNPNSMDIDSEDFTQLPAEVKHEILTEMKEFSKKRRTMFQRPPEKSKDFSQYQLAGLLKRNQLNQRLEGVEREMAQRGFRPLEEDEDGGRSVETRALVSEDTTHYILIKGSKDKDKLPEKELAVQPWSTGTTATKVRPEPLWRPLSENSPEKRPHSPPVNTLTPDAAPLSSPPPSPPSNTFAAEAAPPSPRTLKAIQAAMMNSSSDEESGDVIILGEHHPSELLSPRTMLAIQQSLNEDLADTTSLVGHSSEDAPPLTSIPVKQSLNEELVDTTSLTGHSSGGAPPIISSPIKQSLNEELADTTSLIGHSSEDAPPFTLVPIKRSLNEDLADTTSLIGHSTAPIRPLADSIIHITSSESEKDDSVEDDCKVLHCSLVGDNKEMTDDSHLISTVSNAGPVPPASKFSLLSAQEEIKLLDQIQESKPESGSTSSPICFVLDKDNAKDDMMRSECQPSHPAQYPLPNRQEVTFDPGNSTEESPTNVKEVVESEAVNVESDSEGSFIEVSDIEEEGEENGSVEEEENGSVEEEEDETQQGGRPAGTETDVVEHEAKQSQETRAETAKGEWEHVDLEELLQLETSLESQESTLKAQKQQQERTATTVTGQMYQESQELLRLFGVPFLVAPMEAEAQCAALEQLDQTHGTITDDSDVWLFGARHVYKNFFAHSKYIEQYQYLDIKNQLGLDQAKLINLAYLLGSDYTEGVPGVGYVTGMEILNEFPGRGMEPLISLFEWWSQAQENMKVAPNPNDSKVKKKLRSIQLPAGFPNPSVAQAYLHPTVDESRAAFSWGRPQIELIKDFCLSRFGWNSRRTEEVLQPVMKKLNIQQTQLRIDSFFRLEQQERQAIQSQRLRRAVTCLKRKEQEDEEDGGNDEGCPPSKAEKADVEGTRDEGWAGGFMVMADSVPSLGGEEEGCGIMQSEEQPPTPEAKPKLSPLRAGPGSSSSSGDDSDADVRVTMVTARSVFENKPRGRGRRGVRGKNPRKR
ncbi:DNA excision repair protein ERCC-5 isoform X3 [Brienomyrus brachyistius]|uniref:DNA excision repair protein ERCC-5 isoform X3 n=1 Tax=Brienomyrus brachyistius TaxID=42636 RepID=UPI0020B20DB9|nr:DNA excision repair protein ERCC-5 isoform X3 [Brienomyrus brachyistius]XP_048862355.1 DNA excision repair protein ERCC-5 isoform X3 [Brienomyrus brachyistius]XP_048862356.1 DNA excision repair protein ERCC-5 isoform X3 [Brienomyrus brachyistius]